MPDFYSGSSCCKSEDNSHRYHFASERRCRPLFARPYFKRGTHGVPDLFPHRGCLGIDLTIILIYAAVFHSLNNALYGALALYITTKVLDLVVYGQNTAKVAYIISDKYEEIMQEMLRRDMGVTLLNGKGGYTGAERPLLFCAIRKKEAVSIKRYIKELDPDAFFIVCDASEVLGEGFGEYDPQGL